MLNERNAIGLETSADAFELASLAMTYPDRRFAAAVADGTFAQAWSRAIRQVLGENATEAGAIAGSTFPHKSPDDIFHQLRCSYTNTFLNMPRPKVPPTNPPGRLTTRRCCTPTTPAGPCGNATALMAWSRKRCTSPPTI